jgi:peptidyl-prolyl cis-trans isomerase C
MMQMSQAQEYSPEFSYHLLRNALDSYGKNLAQISPDEYREVYNRAIKSFDLESQVIGSEEARDIIIPDEQVERSFAEVAARYEQEEEFLKDLEANGLSDASLRNALHRELLFDAVMQRVGARSIDVSDIDIHLFYEMHHDRFETPEKRVASHILITVNPEFAENTREAAHERIQDIRNKLDGRTNRFHKFAQRHSECPTAMDGGKLGEVTRGQLYSELESVLFTMEEDALSDIIESDMGFHILYCEKIRPAKRMPLSRVAPRIRDILEQRHQRNCQKNWLSSLQADTGE